MVLLVVISPGPFGEAGLYGSCVQASRGWRGEAAEGIEQRSSSLRDNSVIHDIRNKEAQFLELFYLV